jgi:hypothetical protein
VSERAAAQPEPTREGRHVEAVLDEKLGESFPFVVRKPSLHRGDSRCAAVQGLLDPLDRDGALTLTEDREALEHVEKLANVPRPGMGLDSLQRRLHPDEIEPLPLREHLDQEGDVARALTERNYTDGEYVEAVQQVFPEPSSCAQIAQVLVCRRHDPDVHGERADPTQTFESAVFQDPQESDLRRE